MKKGRKLEMNELGRISIAQFKKDSKLPLIVVLDNIRSLHNVGSVFRTSDAFSIKAVYLCGITAKPPHREIQKTALGATESVEWKYFETTQDALKQLEEDKAILVGVEQVEGSIPLNQFVPQKDTSYALIFGNEVKGVGQDILDKCTIFLEIPQNGTKHSLNVSVSAGVVLWELSKKLLK